jgi:anti-sigma factor RsiW
VTAAPLPMTCADVEKLLHPYLDGEFAAEERALVDLHLASCRRCLDVVAFQRTFKTSLRARLHRPTAPPNLRASVLAALDQADARGDGPPAPIWRRAAPLTVTAFLTVAAAILVFVGAVVPSHADSAVVKEEAIRCHEKNLPVEVGGGAENISSWMVGKVNVPVRPPQVRGSLVGARLNQLRSRDVAQLRYLVDGSLVTLYVFDATGMDITGRETLVAGGRVFQVDTMRGYNILYYRERGVGYALISDLEPDELIQALRE